jgi:outer membrane protein assembly factor BamB
LVPSLAAAQQGGAPEWSQFQGSAGHAGARDDGPAPPYRVRWRYPADGGTALSGAVIFDGKAIAVGRSAVYAIDVGTGHVTWQAPRAGGPLSIPALVAGSGSEPDLLLYLQGPSTENADATSPSASPSRSPSPSSSASANPVALPRGSELVAIDLSHRSEPLWRTPLERPSRTGVTVDGDTAYVADDGGTVYAIAVANGEVRWSKGLEADGSCETFDGARIDSSVAVADGRVVSVARNGDAGSVAVSAYDQIDGACLWRKGSRLGTAAASAPAADGGAVIVGLGDRILRNADPETGEQRWGSIVLSLFLPPSSPAVADGAAYAVDAGGGLYRFDAEDGARRWSYQLNETVTRSSPVVSGDVVLVGLNDGRLVAIDTASGHLVWQGAATPGLIGPIAVSTDAIVAVKGGRRAGLVAFEHDPGGTLVDLPSPTDLDAASTLARFGLAAALALAIVLVPGLIAARRFGGAFDLPAEEDETAEEDA